MLKQLVRSAGRRAGLDIFRASTDPFRWSHTVHDYYPVAPQARWPTTSLPHQRLRAVLDRGRQDYARFVSALEEHAALIHGVGHAPDPADPNAPCWNNTWFTALDGAALVTFLAWKKPARYIEIGSGNSTCFARYAVNALALPTAIISIDPNPRRHIDRICDRVIRQPLEDCDLTVFDALQAGDIVFFDGSHRAFANSDVVVFFFEVLPRLAPGVIVQIHDIFIPDDYPAAWNHRLYNEQYLLAAMLMGGRQPFKVAAPIMYLCQDATFGARVKRVFAAPGAGPDIPFHYPNDTGLPGASFWFEMTGAD